MTGCGVSSYKIATIIRLAYSLILNYNAQAFQKAEVAEQADAPDSKSGDGDIMWVRPPPSAPKTFFI